MGPALLGQPMRKTNSAGAGETAAARAQTFSNFPGGRLGEAKLRPVSRRCAGVGVGDNHMNERISGLLHIFVGVYFQWIHWNLR